MSRTLDKAYEYSLHCGAQTHPRHACKQPLSLGVLRVSSRHIGTISGLDVPAPRTAWSIWYDQSALLKLCLPVRQTNSWGLVTSAINLQCNCHADDWTESSSLLGHHTFLLIFFSQIPVISCHGVE
jgi:hypothetical protein